MTELEQEIQAAISNLSIQVERLSNDEARTIVADAKSRYVSGNPAAWWLSLKGDCDWKSSLDLPLQAVLPCRVGDVYFVPETEEDDLPVYKIGTSDLQLVIQECGFFEYYVMANDLSWLVIENDHNEYFVCRSPSQLKGDRH